MSQLYSLVVKNADLESIPPMVFGPLINLMALDLTGNKLRTEPPALSSLPNLIQLDLSNNSIPYLANTLTSLHRLKILSMDYNTLANIDFRRFPPSLTDLSLRHNNIDTVHFINETVMDLRRLDLAGNKLEHVASGGTINVFPHSVRLLDISSNHIKHISEKAFGHLEKLIMIDLRSNFLSEIKENAVGSETALQKRQVYVSGNPLVCSCSLRWMMHPETKESPVVMDVNDIVCAHSVHPDHLMSLNQADASQQLLCKYQSECLKGCDCCLQPVGECACQSTCPPGCTCWHSVSASLSRPGQNVVHCHRVRIDRLTPIPNIVTELHFPDVRMDASGLDAIGTRNQLVVLNVSNSRISGLTHDTLLQFPRLQTLDLSDTNTESLPAAIFRSNSELSRLHLHDNNLLNLDLSLLSFFSKLKHLTLGGNRNQFTCSCSNPTDMQIWLLNAENRKKIDDFSAIKCKFDETGTMVLFEEIANQTVCALSTISSEATTTSSHSTLASPSPATSRTTRTTTTPRFAKSSTNKPTFWTTVLTHSSEASLEDEVRQLDLVLSTSNELPQSTVTRAPRIRPTTRDSRPSRRNASTHAFMTIVIALLLLTVVCLLFAIGSTVYYRFIRQPQTYIQKGNSAPRADEEMPLNL
ncbi:hypothetical protein L596_004444 [Steinernema carpocapsae]|uniref:LRRCT domain-containing protein n=1 Tax=Steinernema carpocapsae TaxID=34508 RepID=A0A4U8UVU0_STECR|nr:hypothetical protein L596_004444 [Steinernema carpocapsae]